MMQSKVLVGDALTVLQTIPDCSVRTCVTSPPYWRLRDYEVDGQIGLEATLEEYVARLVAVFREVRRALTDDGTLWLNLGDAYNAYNGGRGDSPTSISARGAAAAPEFPTGSGLTAPGLKNKDMLGIPWRVAFALQADGWYLRSDIIWSKPNPMPESIRDRPTRSHEYLFLLAKSSRYYYNADAIAEPLADASVSRLEQPTLSEQPGSARANGGTRADRPMHAEPGRFKHEGAVRVGREAIANPNRVNYDAGLSAEMLDRGTRNRRTVWTIATHAYRDAHFATFPTKLVKPCILAGSEPLDTVLDPFAGAGTTGLVASRLGRSFVGIELNPKYARMARRRLHKDAPLFHPDEHENAGGD